MAQQKAKNKKEGKHVSESTSSSDDLPLEPKPGKKSNEREGSLNGSTKSPKGTLKYSRDDKKRASVDVSSSEEGSKQKSPDARKRNPLSKSSEAVANRSSRDRGDLKPLSWFAQKFGGSLSFSLLFTLIPTYAASIFTLTSS